MHQEKTTSHDRPREIPGIDVLIIDDEESIGEGCRQALEDAGYRAEAALNGELGLEVVKARHPKIAVLDLKMPGIDGFEVLGRINKLDPGIVVLVITGYGTIDDAVRVMKGGAFDLLTKPFGPERLVEAVNRAMESAKASRSEVAAQPLAGKPAPATEGRKELDGLLKGLEALGDAYSAGIEKGRFWEDLQSVEADAKVPGKGEAKTAEKEAAVREIVRDLRKVDAIIAKYQFKKNNLIQILLEVNSTLGWLTPNAMKWVSRALDVPMSRIRSVAEFYESLSLEPQGRHKVHVCTGTACHVRGSENQLDRVSKVLGIKPGETDKNGDFTLETVHCLGCCALAPVLKIDDNYYKNPGETELKKLLASVKEKETESCERK